LACSHPATPPSPPADLATQGAPGLHAIDPARIETTTKYLSSDDLAGRGVGTPGGARAEDYVAEAFTKIGLLPAGERGTYFQTVPFREATLDAASTSLVIHHGGSDTPLVQGEGAMIRPFPRSTDVAIDAPLVFAGYGISRPDLGYDDLAGLDVRGAIVVVYAGAPRTIGGKEVPSTLHAVLGDSGVRNRLLLALGARAVLSIWDPIRSKKMSLADLAKRLPPTSMAWLANGVPESDPVLPGALLDEASIEHLFATASDSHPLRDLWTALDRGEPRRASLNATASLRIRSQHHDLAARNVAASLPGSDPALKAETVVYTAHLDHLGVGAPVNGDAIYNGALDDAVGVAGILEIARAFAALPTRPRRSTLFLAVTAEERGLLGSDYFAAHPTVPLDRLVADINIDGLNPLFGSTDIVALGVEHSTLAKNVAEAARATGYGLSPDEEPEEAYFIRSDQYSFVKRGIPSLFPNAGLRDAHGDKAANRAIADAWSKDHYHRPSDVWRPEYNAAWAAHEAGFDFLLGLSVSMADEKPHWNPRDVFEQQKGQKDR
jgi:hypothetical protein